LAAKPAVHHFIGNTMNELAIIFASVVLLALPVWTLCLVVGSGFTLRSAIRPILYNAIVLTMFCGAWYGGFYVSEYWMHIIDLGAPWSWLGALIVVSFIVSFLSLREHSKAVVKSFVGPVITASAFCLWIGFCAIKFDPLW
jgi:hypothetical protein